MTRPRHCVLLPLQDVIAPKSIDVGIELAKRLEAELVGLFVEDAALLRSADLPFTRQVGFSTAADELFDRGRLERELRVLAERARGELEARASAREVCWSFRVVRGDPSQEFVLAAAASDILVVHQLSDQVRLGHASRRPRLDPETARRHSVLFVRSEIDLAGPVFVGFCESAAGEEALRLAERLAGDDGMVVALVPKDEPELRERARERLALMRSRTRLVEVESASAIERIARSGVGGTLVLCRDDSWGVDQDPEAFVERAGVPLLLVSDSGPPELD